MNRYRKTVRICWQLILIVSCIALLGGAGRAQSGKPVAPDRYSSQLKAAEDKLNRGKYEDALPLLEKLRLERPNDRHLRRLLKRAYQRTKQYAELLDFVQSGLSLSVDREEDRAVIADCQYKLGMDAAAESTLVSLVTPPPRDPRIFRLVAQTYLRNGRHVQAVEMYEQARKQTGDRTLFSRELANIYESRREYADAIREYFVDLQNNPRNLNSVQRKIAAIVQMEGGTDELTGALQSIVRDHPENFLAHRLYAESLLESGDPEAAWPEYLIADRLAEKPAVNLLHYIKRCVENRWYAPARRACLTFFEKYPNHASTVDVRLQYARSMVGLGLVDSAVTILHEVAELFPQRDGKAEIYRTIGDVYFESIHDLDSAETYYRKALDIGRDRQVVFDCSIRLGDCRVRRGDLRGADSAYAASSRVRLTIDQQETAAFRRTELLFFAEAYDSLIQTLKSLLTTFPQGFYANDAIALSLLVKENREPLDWSLKKFSTASLLARQGRLDSARTLLWKLAEDSANGLADDALYKLGQIYDRSEQPDSAALAYGLLIANYPDGFLMPAALTAQGTVYARGMNMPDSARAVFYRVLTEHADSPYLEEARRLMKELGEQ